jgi:hypothetical protein
MTDTEVKIPENFTWGTGADAISTPVADIPAFNLAMLALQGFRHKLGNEVAAKLAAFVKTEDGKGASDADKAAKVAEWRAEMLDKIINGVLGVRASSGPRVSGLDAIKRAVATKLLKVRLVKYNTKHGKNVTLPTKDGTIDFMGTVMTRDQMIDKLLSQNDAEVTAEAERQQAFEQAGADVGEDLFA